MVLPEHRYNNREKHEYLITHLSSRGSGNKP
jgi:hypothetical protein